MNARIPIFALGVLALGLLGEKCDSPFDGVPGEGIGPGVTMLIDPDARCAALSSDVAALAFSHPDRDRVWVSAQSLLLPFKVDVTPPEFIAGSHPQTGSGAPLRLLPAPGDKLLHTLGTGAGGAEEVRLFDPALPGFSDFDVTLGSPVGVTFPYLADGDAVSAVACVEEEPGELDSRGNALPALPSPPCPSGSNGFRTNLITGAAFGGTGSTQHLFVTTQNVGELGGGDPQYFPGTVLVYGVDGAGSTVMIAPDDMAPVIRLDGYNASGVAVVSGTDALGSYSLALVLVRGEVASAVDNPSTPAIEGGYTNLSTASIAVIDANHPENDPPVLVSYPLGAVALVPGIAVDPNQRVAVVGGLEGREVFALDVEALAEDARNDAAGPPRDVVLTPGGFGIPGRTTHADPNVCPGNVFGLAFNDSGDKLFATDYCDGVLDVVGIAGPLGAPLLTNEKKYVFADRIDSTNANTAKGIYAIAVRPDGIADPGADVFVLLSEPEGLLCGLDIDTGPL